MFTKIKESLRQLYLQDARPWPVGYSGSNVNSYYDNPHYATDRFDYFLTNPPFNDSDWFRMDDDVRWQCDVPPKGNANFAWVQHFIYHLAPHGTTRVLFELLPPLCP